MSELKKRKCMDCPKSITTDGKKLRCWDCARKANNKKSREWHKKNNKKKVDPGEYMDYSGFCNF